MIDIHSHVLPNLDDGAESLDVSLAMARAWSEQGVTTVACTPHILPGLYLNSGPQIRDAVARLQSTLDDADIALRLIPGADNHVTPTFVADLRRGHLLTLGDTRYVLVEPPHHVGPVRLEELFHELQVAGYQPILTHPERLSWVSDKYDMIIRLVDRGVLMQLTAGSLTGRFGRRAQALAVRMLKEQRAHIVATDAHNMRSRPPDLLEGWRSACEIVGQGEADNLVRHRPNAILADTPRDALPEIISAAQEWKEIDSGDHGEDSRAKPEAPIPAVDGGGFRERLRRLFS